MKKTLKRLIPITSIAIALIGINACSTIDLIKRDKNDLALDTANFKLLDGKYTNAISLLNTLNYRRSFPSTIKEDSVVLLLKTNTKRSIQLDFMANDKKIQSYKIRGKYKNGYFHTLPKFSISLTPLFPILWGPGAYNMNIGLTKNNDLVYLESHGGIAFIFILPFFGSGSEGCVEIKRLH